MDERMVGWRDVDLAGDRRRGGGLAGHHNHQPVQKEMMQRPALLRIELLTKKENLC
jgi:hypothetical protein